MDNPIDGAAGRKNVRSVIVTFNTADSSFEFSCDSTTMLRKADLVLLRDSETDPWTFLSVNNLPDPRFTWTVANDGSSITITNNRIPPFGSFPYTVTILWNGAPVTSPDHGTRTPPPMIRNQ